MSYASNRAVTDQPWSPTHWQPAASRPLLSDQHWVNLIIVGGVCYQALLCLLNTNLVPMSRAMVGLAEALIILTSLPLLMRRLLPGVLLLGAISVAWLCLIWAINQQVTIKSVRDLAIPLCYFWLGCNMGRAGVADRALKLTIWVVLAVGFLELLLLDVFTQLFNIFSYYVNVGVVNMHADFFVREDQLNLNGIRPEGIGRTILPQLLGPHRVSSVFLEPVSLGNFATLCAAWGLSHAREHWRAGAFFVAAGLLMMVLCDSRFALLSVTVLILLRLLIHGKLLNLCVLAPFAAVALLLAIGLLIPNEGRQVIVSDDFIGRLSYSAWSLLEFDLPMLFGLGHSQNYFDEGYAHSLSSFGLPLMLLLWFSFWLIPLESPSSQRFRAMASVYIALILCVSGTSFFAFKTAGVLWFLIGCSLAKPAPTKPSPHQLR